MTDNVDFGQHTPTRALELLAELRPEFRYTVLHETSVPIEMELDAQVINADHPPEFAKVWWLRIDPTGAPSLFNPRGRYGFTTADTHFIPADEASVMAIVDVLKEVHNGTEPDPDSPPHDAPSLRAALSVPHGALLVKGRDYGPAPLHNAAPSSEIIAQRYKALKAPQATVFEINGLEFTREDLIALHPEVHHSLVSVAADWRIAEVRKHWRERNEMHPHDPGTITALADKLTRGEWLGQLPIYLPGIGQMIAGTTLSSITGLSQEEILVQQIPLARDNVFLELAQDHTFVVAKGWRPTRHFSEFAEVGDVVKAFDADHHDVVREIVVDAYMAETAGDLARKLDSLDSGFSFEGDAPHELGIRDLGLGDA